ncbi:MAG: PD-(D/E)XK nuclease superfamily protein [Verrucomicrobiota bacterium]
MLKAALQQGGYQIKEQVTVGTRPNGGKHKVDLVASRDQTSLLISLKWQQSSGTAEQKVPYEIICLSEALKQTHPQHQKAYLILGGNGWTLKNFYLKGGLNKHLKLDHPVEILDLETFVARANQNQL